MNSIRIRVVPLEHLAILTANETALKNDYCFLIPHFIASKDKQKPFYANSDAKYSIESRREQKRNDKIMGNKKHTQRSKRMSCGWICDC